VKKGGPCGDCQPNRAQLAAVNRSLCDLRVGGQRVVLSSQRRRRVVRPSEKRGEEGAAQHDRP